MIWLDRRRLFSLFLLNAAAMPPASPAPAALGAMRPAEASLLRWAHAKGVKESWPLRPAFCPESNCRGMVATRAIQEGEVRPPIPFTSDSAQSRNTSPAFRVLRRGG